MKKDDQSFPDTAHTALIVIDMINDLEFEGGETLLRYALPVAENIAGLKRRAKQAGIPVIYVNDNFGRWQSNLREAVDRCLQKGICGRPLAERLQPDHDDYFVLKPKHSGFFGTPLEILLNYLGAKTLILTGISGDICVLFTAYDAYMRNFRLFVPADCIASLDPLENRHALKYMERVLKVDTKPSVELDGTAFQV